MYKKPLKCLDCMVSPLCSAWKDCLPVNYQTPVPKTMDPNQHWPSWYWEWVSPTWIFIQTLWRMRKLVNGLVFVLTFWMNLNRRQILATVLSRMTLTALTTQVITKLGFFFILYFSEKCGWEQDRYHCARIRYHWGETQTCGFLSSFLLTGALHLD